MQDDAQYSSRDDDNENGGKMWSWEEGWVGLREGGRTYQEGPRPDEGGPQRGCLAGLRRAAGEAQRAAEREADGTDQVPEADVPAQGLKGRRVPVWLCLEHEEPGGDYEARATDDLRGKGDVC